MKYIYVQLISKITIMKCLIIFLCLSCTILFVACTEKPATTPETVTEVMVTETPRPANLYKPTPKDTISKATFDLWVKNWEKGLGKNPVTKTIKYFNMPIIDYSELLGELPTSSRLYLGIDESVVPNMPHIMLVGVDSLGNNMTSQSGKIYDISQPCPPACGTGGDK